MSRPVMENVIFDNIRRQIMSRDVVLYLRGCAAFPLCGPSAAVVQILSYMGVAFKDINALEDGKLRRGLKDYLDWPTLPLLFVKGEFVGGCDIVREMYENGELHELFRMKGIGINEAA